MIAQLHSGNPANTLAYVCSHILTALKSGALPESLYWTRDEDTCINAMCGVCDAAMETDARDDIEIGVVAEGSVVQMIEEMKKRAN